VLKHSLYLDDIVGLRMFLFTLWRSHGYSENLVAFPQPVNLGDPLMQL